jgi:hypothetical protein
MENKEDGKKNVEMLDLLFQYAGKEIVGSTPALGDNETSF